MGLRGVLSAANSTCRGQLSVLRTQPHATEPLFVTTTMLPHLALQNESESKWGESKQFLEIHIFRKWRHSAFLGLSSEQQLFPFQSKHVHRVNEGLEQIWTKAAKQSYCWPTLSSSPVLGSCPLLALAREAEKDPAMTL